MEWEVNRTRRYNNVHNSIMLYSLYDEIMHVVDAYIRI